MLNTYSFIGMIDTLTIMWINHGSISIYGLATETRPSKPNLRNILQQH